MQQSTYAVSAGTLRLFHATTNQAKWGEEQESYLCVTRNRSTVSSDGIVMSVEWEPKPETTYLPALGAVEQGTGTDPVCEVTLSVSRG